jgi:4-amino-4-deoxy-L-arabinose transferase-like glycosyltransferase
VNAQSTRVGWTRHAGPAGGLLLALAVVLLLVPFLAADPPPRLTKDNAHDTDEGFNLANARQRVLFGEFATGDVDRSLTNGAYSAIAATVFRATAPKLVTGRAISVVAVAAAVLLLALGLAEPLGTAAALLAAASLAGANLLLEYGRLAMVEPTLVAFLTGGFVLAVRAIRHRSPWAGAGAGLLLAAAVSIKAVAVVPLLAVLAVLIGPAAWRRDRQALMAGLAALGTAAAAASGWVLLVALPNLERLRTALRIWPPVRFPHTAWEALARLGHYASSSDNAILRSAPLLLAAVIGVAVLGWRWRSLDRAARDTLVMAALWGFGLWLAVAVGTHGPNRYVVPALPGLAVLAGFGLATAVPSRSRGRASLLVVLALTLALPGTAKYLRDAAASGNQREHGQRALAAALPEGAVVYGAYAPTLLFDTRAELLTLWPSAGANVGDPVGRFGITHVLAAPPGDISDPTLRVAELRPLRHAEGLLQVPWDQHTLHLHELPPPRHLPGPGDSP